MTEPGTARTYGAYGLTYESPVPLVGFAPSGGPADVVISRGPTPERLAGATALGAFWSATPDEVLIEAPAVVRHHVTRDGKLTVERAAAYAEDDDLIYGVPIAATLAFAGLTCLHGAGVVPAGREDAVLLVGPNGAGKSSIATALAMGGGRVLCDNLAALDVDPERLLLRPGPSVTRLWADAAEELGVDVTPSPRVNPDTPKHVVGHPPVTRATPLGEIIVVTVADGERPALVTLAGHEAIVAVLDNTFRRGMMAVLTPALMLTAATIAARIPIRRLLRPATGWGPGAVAAFLAPDSRT